MRCKNENCWKMWKMGFTFFTNCLLGVVALNTLCLSVLETVKGTLNAEFDSIFKLMSVLN